MIKLFLSLALILLIITESIGQTDTVSVKKSEKVHAKDTFALFAGNDILDVTINFDLGAYMKKNLKDESLDGKLMINLGGDTIGKKIKIKTRGIFREQFCSFPPMEINFKKKMPAYHTQGSIKKLKLVTHCEQGKGSDDYILREYLVYKLYNLFTDTSYRVRLAHVNYVDVKKNKKTITQYGFFIEPADVLAARLNAMPIRKVTLTQKYIIPKIITRIAIFNYMIGNYDWAVPNQHNISVFKSIDLSANQMAIAIPYDFDFTGFVNPYYAVPAEDTGIKNIRERIFTGICRTREEFRNAIMEIVAKKEQMADVINNFSYMNPKSKKDLSGYLDEFIKQAESKNGMEVLLDILMNSCKPL
jgi:hypothetical protein